MRSGSQLTAADVERRESRSKSVHIQTQQWTACENGVLDGHQINLGSPDDGINPCEVARAADALVHAYGKEALAKLGSIEATS